ncbi:hypothetical protein A4R35_22145 [Thermogemmatispora tikiterensis]|uniref:Uncharacterized protein n=1 Tax=Thermogemmatispora tikiterensis TaxID=1825093 RepID=A0A328VK33_9CHLR|nr:hypothetical protein A4R35_22145 [Thermogemmatispora tikiterensis]
MVVHSLSLLKYRGWFSYLFILTEGEVIFIPRGSVSSLFPWQVPLEHRLAQYIRLFHLATSSYLVDQSLLFWYVVPRKPRKMLG